MCEYKQWKTFHLFLLLLQLTACLNHHVDSVDSKVGSQSQGKGHIEKIPLPPLGLCARDIDLPHE